MPRESLNASLACLGAAIVVLVVAAAPVAAQPVAIHVDDNGDVGFGTNAPDDGDPLAERFIEVKEGSGDVRAVLDYGTTSPSFGELMFQSGNVNQWSYGSWETPSGDNDFYIFNYTRSEVDLGIDGTTGDVTLSGDLTISGNCGDGNGGGGGADGCDGVFAPDYDLPSIEEHAAEMWQKKHLPAVGPTPDGERIRFSVQDRHFAVLNELEKAHIYIEQLNRRVLELEEQNARFLAIESELASLRAVLQAK